MKILNLFFKNLFYILPIVIVTLFIASIGPVSHVKSNLYRILLSVTCVILLIIVAYVRRIKPKITFAQCLQTNSPAGIFGKIVYTVIILCCIFSFMNYYRFDRLMLTTVRDYYDLTYYYLNSKYFEELGYQNIYPAMLVADKETNNQTENIKKYRELKKYRSVDKQKAFDSTLIIKNRFSRERWIAFKHDVDFFLSQSISGGWRYFFKDHGYNPPPTWTIVGKLFSSNVPVESLKLITSIDIILIILMFICIGKAYGAESMFFSILFFTVTFSGRWPIAGQALLRFDWLSTLVMSMCMYKMKRHTLSGCLLAYSALVRIFPAIFFFPFIVHLFRYVVQRKSINRELLAFFKGASILSILFLALAVYILGTDAFIKAKNKILLHAGPESYSSLRVGFGDALVFKGETSRVELNFNGGTRGKAEQIKKLSPYIFYSGVLSLIFIFFIIIRTKDNISYYMPLCVLPIYLLTTPQINYYNLRILLVLWHTTQLSKIKNVISLGGLFFIETAALYSSFSGHINYHTTSTTSVGLGLYFLLIIGTLLYESIRQPKTITTTSIKIITTLFILSIIVPFIYYSSQKIKPAPPIPILQSKVSIRKAKGTPWNADGNIIFDKRGIIIKLKNISHSDRMEISTDYNDLYRISYIKNNRCMGSNIITKKRRFKKGGLAIHRINIPKKAAEHGYNKIKITPAAGDDHHSVGHVILTGANK